MRVDTSAVLGTALFAGLDERDAAAAAARLRKVVLAPEQVLFREGDPGDRVYVLLAGELDVTAVGAGQEHHMATLEANAIFGHLGLLTHQSRSATVVARTPVELWEMTREGFHAALDAGEVWAGRFLLAAAGQLALTLGSVIKRMVALIEKAACAEPAPAATRVAELDELRKRLFSEWSF